MSHRGFDLAHLACVSSTNPTRITLRASDGVELAGDLWFPDVALPVSVVVVNPATAVKASYYHRFARFLCAHGFAVLTYDYRGVGESRHFPLKVTRDITKFDWGAYDCEAALEWAVGRFPNSPLDVVAHSIGGLMVGLASHGRYVRRCLTVGAQFAYWPDYAAQRRWSMFLRWHVAMPLMTKLLGYFPASTLGWHEDLPAGVAYEWAFRRGRLEESYRYLQSKGGDPLRHFCEMTGEILAIGVADDPFGTPQALDRLLAYYTRAKKIRIEVHPQMLGVSSIGHFAYFHDRFEQSLWVDALRWFREGRVSQRHLVGADGVGSETACTARSM